MNISDYFKYTKWEDVGIEYLSSDFKWVIIQTRTRIADHKRYIRHIQITRWSGVLSEETKKRLALLMNLNELPRKV